LFPIFSFAGNCDQVVENDKLTACLAGEFSRADTLLNKAYNSLRNRLDKNGKDLLKSGQRAWLTYRDKDCELQASAASGGQAYEPMYISCQTEKTLSRIKELKN
jgi:uncharacterized protein YecT (DUF1311 family)